MDNVITQEKIVLVNSLSPGDILIMSCAIRALHKEYPGRFQVDVRSPCNEIFMNSPYITPLHASNPVKEREIIEILKRDENHPAIELDGIKYLIAHYPEIHRSGLTGTHFSDGHRMFLSKQLGIQIPSAGLKPDIFLSNTELASINPLNKFYDYTGRYWVINAGIKNDYTLKWYDHYQEVVDLLKGQIKFVQIGHAVHNHPPLDGVLDMRGKTNLRELFRICHDADGVLTCVSMPMVVASALNKPCVVVAGAREGVRWQLNPDHQYLYRNGVMKCASYDGCWKSSTPQCINKHENGQPMCMELISPEEIVRSIQLYYLGGRIEIDTPINDVKIPQNEVKMPSEKNENSIKNAEFFGKTEEKTINLLENHKKIMIDAHIFNILRILKKYNPDDGYLQAYQWHYNKRGLQWMDSYHIMHWIGSMYAPSRVLEIGCRTGVSICQLLSSYFNYDKLERVVLCDVFAEQGSPSGILRNLDVLNIPSDKVEFIIGSSIEEMPKLISQQAYFDYILVDGCHDKPFARQDLINAAALCEKSGYILFDDLTPDGCSLQDVWDWFKSEYKEQFFFAEDHHGKGIGIARRL